MLLEPIEGIAHDYSKPLFQASIQAILWSKFQKCSNDHYLVRVLLWANVGLMVSTERCVCDCVFVSLMLSTERCVCDCVFVILLRLQLHRTLSVVSWHGQDDAVWGVRVQDQVVPQRESGALPLQLHPGQPAPQGGRVPPRPVCLQRELSPLTPDPTGFSSFNKWVTGPLHFITAWKVVLYKKVNLWWGQTVLHSLQYQKQADISCFLNLKQQLTGNSPSCVQIFFVSTMICWSVDTLLLPVA